MNILNKDLNMLLIFKVVFQELNASRAAERLAMSQPAMSHALNKLRRDFHDPLFVRKSRGLSPTPKAIAIAEQINAIVEQMDALYKPDKDNLAFLMQERDIVIYTTDYMQAILLPPLLEILNKQAPNVRLMIKDPQGQLPRSELETGQCDLAIAGYFSNLPDSYYQQKITTERFVTLACQSNEFLDKDLSLEHFLKCRHIVTTLTGDLNGIVDAALAQQNLKRNIIAGIPSFLATTDLLENSNHLLTCLESLAARATKLYPAIKSYPSPVDLEPVDIYQVWHQRTHEDKLSSWLRKTIYRIFES